MSKEGSKWFREETVGEAGGSAGPSGGGGLGLLPRGRQGPRCDRRKGWLGWSSGKITGREMVRDQGVGWPAPWATEHKTGGWRKQGARGGNHQ